MNLELLRPLFSVCRLEPGSAFPAWARGGELLSISSTREEVSVVCESGLVPPGQRNEPGWRCLKVAGPLDFGLTGILSSLLEPLAVRRISVFAMSTFDTDYLLVKEASLDAALAALRQNGHAISA